MHRKTGGVKRAYREWQDTMNRTNKDKHIFRQSFLKGSPGVTESDGVSCVKNEQEAMLAALWGCT